jgi:hypothetical protein
LARKRNRFFQAGCGRFVALLQTEQLAGAEVAIFVHVAAVVVAQK